MSFQQKAFERIFFRSNRSYIINADKTMEIILLFNNTFMLKMLEEKIDIPVSRNNYN
ncbi:LytTR family transcriptional regulator DNA-binding domain-containing protein [Clostridium psychrophilum]|uniref:LytTR family transcriptional regulator DNA-binding domain-containing protein n=1 Tax=Clostridium psychrophilum TaxID=132926 RepID=UPI001C0DCBAD|nr:LytTR family transcriptional regulator DNA-binding domain-containing protein [Clostridium psychrophilum]